jgi:hypothetical protein
VRLFLASFLSHISLTQDIERLKVLSDEIKKPYFISLKKFLWSEGVMGPQDKCTKVFPARTSFDYFREAVLYLDLDHLFTLKKCPTLLLLNGE